jgi:hypothetical protein
MYGGFQETLDDLIDVEPAGRRIQSDPGSSREQAPGMPLGVEQLSGIDAERGEQAIAVSQSPPEDT